LYNIEEAVKQTVLWYKEFYYNRKNIIKFTDLQVKEFLDKYDY
jgi:hypothetical protein